MKEERTQTGRRLIKETKRGIVKFYNRDVDGKTFLEAKGSGRYDKTFVSVSLTRRDLEEIAQFCQKAKYPYCFGKRNVFGSEYCRECRDRKDCTIRTSYSCEIPDCDQPCVATHNHEKSKECLCKVHAEEKYGKKGA